MHPKKDFSHKAVHPRNCSLLPWLCLGSWLRTSRDTGSQKVTCFGLGRWQVNTLSIRHINQRGYPERVLGHHLVRETNPVVN